jgi:hypothetical protein
MTVRGKVKNGKVVLDDPKVLPEGTEVEVRPARRKLSARSKKPAKTKSRPRSLAERLAPFIGEAKGLPPDASVDLDHYLYGLPKRK